MKKPEESDEIKKLADAILKTGLANSYSLAIEMAKDLSNRASNKGTKIDFQGNMNNVLKKAIEEKPVEKIEEKMTVEEEADVEEILEEAETGKLHPKEQIDDEEQFLPKKAKALHPQIDKAKKAFRQDAFERVGKSFNDIEDDIDNERHSSIKLLIEDLVKNHDSMSNEEFKYELNKLEDIIRNESADTIHDEDK